MQKKDDDENIEASRDLNLYNSNQVNFWNSAQTYDSYNMSDFIWPMLYESFFMTHVKKHAIELNHDEAFEAGNTAMARQARSAIGTDHTAIPWMIFNPLSYSTV